MALLKKGIQYTTAIEIPEGVSLNSGVHILMTGADGTTLRVPISEVDINPQEGKSHIVRVDPDFQEIDQLLNSPSYEWVSTEHT